MFNTKASSASSINNKMKTNFVQKNAKVKISNHAVQKPFASGSYTQHHPAQCNQVLNAQPIHLKKQSAVDGKPFVRIKCQSNVRDLLLPSTANVYPTILPAQEIRRLAAKSQSVTIDQKKVELQRKYDEWKYLEEECEKRKAHLKEIDKMKLVENWDDDFDSVAEKQKILDRSMIAKIEDTEEFKRVNHLIAAKKCQLTRAAQVLEKREIQSELRDYNFCVEKTMLDDCEKALQLESLNALARRKNKAQLADERKMQVNRKELAEKMASEKALEMDKAQAYAKSVENATLEEEEKKQRIEQMFKTREDIENFKALRETLKSKALEEERISEIKAQEYMRKKQENIKKIAEAKRLVKEEKQRKADELLMLQAKLLETRNQQGETNIKRLEEEKEREFRRKAKEDALKRKILSKEVHDVRSYQLQEHQRKRQIELEQERVAANKLMEKIHSDEMEEKRNEERRRIEREKYQNDIMMQIEQKKMKKQSEEEKAKIEFAREQEMEKERIAKIESVIQSKLVEMKEAKIPLEDIRDIQRKIKSKLGS